MLCRLKVQHPQLLACCSCLRVWAWLQQACCMQLWVSLVSCLASDSCEALAGLMVLTQQYGVLKPVKPCSPGVMLRVVCRVQSSMLRMRLKLQSYGPSSLMRTTTSDSPELEQKLQLCTVDAY